MDIEINIEEEKEKDNKKYLENFFQDDFDRLRFINYMKEYNSEHYYNFDHDLDVKNMKNLPRDVKKLYLTKNKIRFISTETSEYNNFTKKIDKKPKQKGGFIIEEQEIEFNETPDFGSKVSVRISRNGDLYTRIPPIYIELPPFTKYKILINLPNKLEFLLLNKMNNEKINYISSGIKHLSFKDKCWNTLYNLPNKVERIDFVEKRNSCTIIKKFGYKLNYIMCCCDNKNIFSEYGLQIKDKYNDRIIVKYIEEDLKDKMFELHC